MKESNIEKLCRLAAAKLGLVLWRNQRGKTQDMRGQWISYGLGPDGASDEIGFYSTVITPDMVGQRIAIFSAIEIKKPGAKTNPARLHNQISFIANIRKHGGIAGVAECPEDLEKIIKKCLTRSNE